MERESKRGRERMRESREPKRARGQERYTTQGLYTNTLTSTHQEDRETRDRKKDSEDRTTLTGYVPPTMPQPRTPSSLPPNHQGSFHSSLFLSYNTLLWELQNKIKTPQLSIKVTICLFLFFLTQHCRIFPDIVILLAILFYFFSADLPICTCGFPSLELLLFFFHLENCILPKPA